MGLDMYLIEVPKEELPKDFDDYIQKDEKAYEKSSNYGRVVAVWRKANMIHNWFCGHCEELENEVLYKVTLDNLKELLETIEDVLESKKVSTARRELPTCSGFFYGSTEYDDWYWEYLKDSKKYIEDVINSFDPDTDGLIYYASW